MENPTLYTVHRNGKKIGYVNKAGTGTGLYVYLDSMTYRFAKDTEDARQFCSDNNGEMRPI